MNFNSEDLKRIVQAAFPGYRGRKIKARECVSGSMSTLSYWDGGSRDQFVIVDTHTLTASPIAGINPISPPANWRNPTAIPSGKVIVEHSIFCGKDAGCTVHFVREVTDTQSC